MKARRLDVSLDEYRADQIGEKTASLSQSVAKVLLDQSPLHAYQIHPRLGGGEIEMTDEMDRGSLIHRLVLGAGANVEVCPFPDWRTTKAKEARDDARARGYIPILEHKYAEAQVAASKITSAVGTLLTGDSEVMVAWEDDGVLCRAQFDHLNAGTLIDLKTVPSANPKALARKAVDLGWSIQSAAYRRALEALHPEFAGRTEFLVVAAETEPPYAVSVVRLGNTLEQLGEAQWARAVRTWERCLRTDTWEGYGDSVQTLAAPPWALQALEAEVENG